MSVVVTIGHYISVYAGSVMVFDEADVKGATDNFATTNVIGKGGFGEVFRGRLRHTDVAIKVLSAVSACKGGWERQFVMWVTLKLFFFLPTVARLNYSEGTDINTALLTGLYTSQWHIKCAWYASTHILEAV